VKVSSQTSLAVFPFVNNTGDEDYNWLEHGLRETSGQLIEQSSELTLILPESDDSLPDRNLNVMTAMFGANYGLRCQISKESDQFQVQWQIGFNNEDKPISGQFNTSDASLIARQLTYVIISQLSDQPISAIDLPLLKDALASELYSRAIEELHRDNRSSAQTLLKAALIRLPNNTTIQSALMIASFDESNIGDSLNEYRAMLNTLPVDSLKLRNRLSYEIGTQLWFAGDRNQASELLTQVVSSTEPSELLHAQALNSLSFVRQSEQRFEEAWEYAKQAELLLREQKNPHKLSMVLTNLGYLAEDFGRLTQSGQYHQQALEIREHYQFPSLIAASQYGLARISHRRGDFETAITLLQKALETTQRLNKPYDVFDNLEEMAEVRMRQGQFEAAGELIGQARSIAKQQGDSLGVAWADQVQVRLWLRQGLATEEGLETIKRSHLALTEMGETQDAYLAQLERAELLILLGKIQQADTLLSSLKNAEANSNRQLALKRDRVLAKLISIQDSQEQALSHLQQTLLGTREIGSLAVEADVALDIGELSIQSGDLVQAQRMLNIASSWSKEYFRTQQLADSIARISTPI